MEKFIFPDFSERNIELRCIDDEVCIYATKEGLYKIISNCQKLIESPQIGHIHLNDYDLLTENSLDGVIAIFEK